MARIDVEALIPEFVAISKKVDRARIMKDREKLSQYGKRLNEILIMIPDDRLEDLAIAMSKRQPGQDIGKLEQFYSNKKDELLAQPQTTSKSSLPAPKYRRTRASHEASQSPPA